MVRWLVFLVWLFSFSTWKAIFVRLFWKPPSPDVANHGVEERVLSGNDHELRSNEEEVDATSVHQRNVSDYLAKLLSDISSEWVVIIDFKDDEYGYGPLTCDEDAKVKEILGAVATSTVLKKLQLQNIWPMTWEEVSEALLANQSVKGLGIGSAVGAVHIMSRVLLKNTCLEEVAFLGILIDNKLAMLLSNVLLHNRALKFLGVGFCRMDEKGWKVLLDPLSEGGHNNSVLQHLGIEVDSGRESNCDVHIGSLVRRNTSIRSLEIGVYTDVARSVVSSIGEALHFNTQLLKLDLFILGGLGVEWIKLFLSLTPDAQGQQANTTLEELTIYNGYEDSVEEIEHDSLCDMLRRNTSLIMIKLGNNRSFLNNRVYVIQLLESLKSNKCLEILDLYGCKAVEGRRVFGAIMDLLDENHSLKEIKLWGTPLDADGSAEVVKATLKKKAKHRLWEVVQGMAETTPTSGRVFLCGEPHAGKTTLRKTIMENDWGATPKTSKRSKLKALLKLRKGDEQVSSVKNSADERTRGIEVHNLQHGDVALTIWDMAGQEEYHGFHDLVVPNLSMSGSCCSFVLVCNPVYRDGKPHQLKKMEDIIMELQYWLKFIVSNTRISNLYRPHVMVVFTHIDECPWNINLLRKVTKDLKSAFEEFVEFEGDDFMINAKIYKDSGEVFEAMVDHMRGLLARVPKTIAACDKLQKVIAKRIEDNAHELVVDWDRFSEICDEVVESQMMDSSNPKLMMRRKEFVASSLHDRGHLIYHEDLKIVIMNPHLFCHGIMGELMNREKMSRYVSNVQHGITKGNLQMALSSTTTAKQHKVALEDVLQVMQKMELCYEQEDGTTIIPSLLSDGHGKLTWPIPTKASIYRYIGRRLTIDDRGKTLLSPGFFPRLQVFLRKEFGRTCEIIKNMIKFIDDGRETIIEYSGSPAFDIDIMMRSNGNEDMIILDSLQRDVIKHIVTLCSHPTLGCPGVKLVEHIMRPLCVEKLVPHTLRSNHQVVMVENLKQKVMRHGNLALKYDWPSEGEVLQMDYDDAKTLLGGHMSNDVLNQLMVDLKSIECQVSQDKGSMDAIGHARSMGITKALKPSHMTNIEDVWIMINQRLCEHEEYFDQTLKRFEKRINNRFDILEGKMQEIKLLQENLLPRVCRRLDELVKFTVEFQQHKYPRLPHFKECRNRGFNRMVPGMRTFVLHLLCEHKDGFHVVEDQKGCEFLIGTESTQKFQTVVKWGLRVFTLLLKVGAHVGAGMSSVVPDLERIALLVVDTPGIGLDEVNMRITQTLMDVVKPQLSRTEEMVAEQWLIDELKDKCKGRDNIESMFKLHKIRYKMEGDSKAGCVAWICDEHYEEGRHSNTLDPFGSTMDV